MSCRSLFSTDIVIRGISSVLPSQLIDNDSFLDRFSKSEIDSISKLSGVHRRYFCNPNTTTADLCTSAARHLLSRLSWEPNTIDALIFITQTPSNRMPASSAQIHSNLGLPQNSVPLDINLGCSGFPYGLWIAHTLIQSGLNRVLLLVGEKPSSIVDPNDRSTALLFGDAGTATALERSATCKGLSQYSLHTDGASPPPIHCSYGAEYVPDFLTMDGAKVFEFTLSKIPPLLKSVSSSSPKKIDFFCLHQANKFMLQYIIKKSGLSPGFFPINIHSYGNTSSASIPLLVTSELASQALGGDLYLSCLGFGVGLSWACSNILLPKTNHLYLTTYES